MSETDFSLPEGTHTVVLGMGDANGIMRGKRIPATHWDNICKNGNAYSIALFAIDMTCDVWDTPYEPSERRAIFAAFGFVADFSARIERVRGVARVFSPGSGPPCGAMA